MYVCVQEDEDEEAARRRRSRKNCHQLQLQQQAEVALATAPLPSAGGDSSDMPSLGPIMIPQEEDGDEDMDLQRYLRYIRAR